MPTTVAIPLVALSAPAEMALNKMKMGRIAMVSYRNYLNYASSPSLSSKVF